MQSPWGYGGQGHWSPSRRRCPDSTQTAGSQVPGLVLCVAANFGSQNGQGLAWGGQRGTQGAFWGAGANRGGQRRGPAGGEEMKLPYEGPL